MEKPVITRKKAKVVVNSGERYTVSTLILEVFAILLAIYF